MHRNSTFSISRFFIGIFWLIGLIIGVVLSHYVISGHTASSSKFDVSASFSGIFISYLLPILSVILIRKLCLDSLVYIVLLLDGFLFSFCSLYLSHVLNYPAFLINLLHMFSRGCCSSFLVILCQCLFIDLQSREERFIGTIITASVLVCLLDYFLILKFIRI